MPFKYTCERCGKDFFRGSKSTPHKTHRFCSIKCKRTPKSLIVQDDQTILVPVGQGKFAVIDAADWEVAFGHNWHLNPFGYAVRNPKKSDNKPNKSPIFLHREIVQAKDSDNFVVDHIDRDPLNNRKSNLRPCGQFQNVHNGPIRSHNTSGFRGVSRTSDGCKWVARISVKGKVIYLGRFDAAADAARAYDAAALELLGSFASLNFQEKH